MPFDSKGLKHFLVFVNGLLCKGECIVDELIVHETSVHLAFPWLSVAEIVSAENKTDLSDNGEHEVDDCLKEEFADQAELVDSNNGKDNCEVDECLEGDFAETQQFIVGKDVQAN